MCQQIAEIRQALDHKKPQEALHLCERVLAHRLAEVIDSEDRDEVRELQAWAHLIAGQKKEADELAHSIHLRHKKSYTGLDPWVQVLQSDESSNPEKNYERWLDVSRHFWQKKLEANPKNEIAKQAIEHIDKVQRDIRKALARAHEERHIAFLRGANEAGEEIAS